MRRTYRGVLVAVLALAPVAATAPAEGFAILATSGSPSYKIRWGTDSGGLPCGPTPLAPFRTCTVKFAYSSAVTARAGWAPAVGAASGNWCDTYDPKRAYALAFCYFNYSPEGGVGGHGVGVGATNLGGPNPAGELVLGRTEFGALTVNPADPGWADLSTPFIWINTNSAISWYANSAESYTVPSGSKDLQTTMTHEFGHALGLAHPGAGPSATGPVMLCFQSPTGWNHGKTDDFNGLLYIYSDRTKTPGSSPC